MNISNEASAALSELKDPFFAKNITDIDLHWWKRWDGRVLIWGKVTFTSGSTKGEQKIEAESFDQLLAKTKAFIETLAVQKK